MQIKIPPIFSKIRQLLDGLKIPGLGISWWRMIQIYGKAIGSNPLGRQAAAISWGFFLSLFPFLLFLLSLIPYFPHYEDLQYYLFEIIMPRLLPGEVLNDVRGYIQNILVPNLKSINNLSIVLALIFGTNGTHSLINGFNLNTGIKRNFFKEYSISILISIAFVLFGFATIFGLYYSEVVLKLLRADYDFSWFEKNLTPIIGFISFPLFYFLLLTLLYWVGCLKITRWKQSVPGAILTTILFVLLTYLFAIYLSNFGRYNILYGSIGTIIIFMIWTNLNILLILLGNELNLAIKKVKYDEMLAEDELT